MAVLTPAERINRAAALVAEALAPLTTANAPRGGEIDSWLAVFAESDRVSGRPPVRRSMRDPRVLLQVQARYWKTFRYPTRPQQTAWAKELLQGLNKAAHEPDRLGLAEAVRLLGIAHEYALSVDADEAVGARLEQLHVDLMRELLNEQPTAVEAPAPEPSTDAPPVQPAPPQPAPAQPAPAQPASVPAAPPADEEEVRADTVEGAVPQQDDNALLIELVTRFGQQIPGSFLGLDYRYITHGDIRVIVFFRQDLNFALVHNRVSPLAGVAVARVAGEDSDLEVRDLRAHLGSLPDRTDAEWSLAGPLPGRSSWWASPAELSWQLPVDHFIEVDEARADSIEFSFTHRGETVRESIPIRILAHDQWAARAVPELIAAFVRPRAEAVTRILSTASDLLGRRTGNPSLVGYQDTPERVDETARAIYDAIHELGIRYAEPPANFEHDGQKVRTADVVVRSLMGTCIDTAVLFAATLEEAGLQPFIVFVPGHAMVAYTRRDLGTEMVLAGTEEVSNLVGSGIFVPIETTAATAGSQLGFVEAVTRASQTIADHPGATRLINISAAHRRVRPLPTLVDREGVRTIVVVEQSRPSIRTPLTDGSHSSGGTKDLTASGFPLRVQRWRSDLLDLSLRNPLLKLADSRGLELLVPGEDLGELEDRLAQNAAVRLTPDHQVDALDRERGLVSAAQFDSATLSRLFREEGRTFVRSVRGSSERKLVQLRRDAKALKEETGATALFVSLGLLTWRAGRDQVARSPLFLLPVELTGSRTRPYEIRLESNAEIQPNHCLIEKLRQEFNLSLPQLEQPPTDDAGIDLPRVFRELRESFVENRLDFAVDARSHLAILQFATLDMWRDLSENWERFTSSNVVNHLIHSGGELFSDPVQDRPVLPTDEADAYLPVPADGSQLEAVVAASQGRTFVLEGPPGTGKSQTITNMIADGLAAGRTVLFVAEKQAALTVVHDRLKRIGLEPLVLNVHGKDQSAAQVRQQLRSAIDEVRKGNEVVFEENRTRLRRSIEHLAAYPGLLHRGEPGQSIWERYQRCLLLQRRLPDAEGWQAAEIPVTAALLELDPARLHAIVGAVSDAALRSRGQTLPPEWDLIGPPAAGPDGDRAAPILAAARALADAADALPPELATTVGGLDPDQATVLEAWLADLPSRRAVLPGQLGQPRLPAADLARRVADLQSFRQRWDPAQVPFTRAAALADCESLQAEYEAAQRSGIMQRGRLTKLALGKIASYAEPAHEAAVRADPLRFLASLRMYRQEHQELGRRLSAGIPQLAGKDLRGNEALQILGAMLTTERDYEQHADLTRHLVARLPDVAPRLDALVQRDPDGAEAGRPGASLRAFDEAWSRLRQVANSTERSLTAWLAGQRLLQRISQCAQHWRSASASDQAVADFRRRLEFGDALQTLDEYGLAPVADQIRRGRPTAALTDAIELAVERRRLADQLRAEDLDVFDSATRASQVGDYVRVAKELKRQTWSELPARLLQRRNAGAVSVGLRKEIDRKRGGSIRRLFEAHGGEILGLTPVVLMSPASVARFLPADGIRFDTVIFDEASQVRVADSVGALGRADAAIIVGDSKQMPPTNMFRQSTTDADEDPPATIGTAVAGEGAGQLEAMSPDQESILSEAVGSGLEQKWLSWHYRSQHEQLISFSNMKYYNGQLQVFPGPPEHRPELGIRAEFVGGVFDRGATRTNRAEADRIVADIGSRLANQPEVSIGVVTFNTQQRDLILDLLEQSEDPLIRQALEREQEPLFVKNLENVQGDERDAILFSIAFSRNPETGVLSHNFGPLNNVGGERRFNVAITRARSTVILYTSIRSTDIDLAKTRAEGLQHLKEYLAYAEGTAHAALGGTQQFDAEDLYREELATALRSRGLEVISDVGTSRFRVDLAVRASAEHGWLALVLDTREWAGRAITADRESLPGEILQGVMGWRDTVQVLLPAWIQDPAAVLTMVAERAESLRPQPVAATPPGEQVPEPLAAEPTAARAPADTDDLALVPRIDEIDPLAPIRGQAVTEQPAVPATVDRTRAHPFVAADTGVVGEPAVLDDLRDAEQRALVAAQLTEVIETEGPVEAVRAAKIVAGRFGHGRIRLNRVGEILRCATTDPQWHPEFGRFFWPAGLSDESYRGYRPRTSTIPIDELNHVEIANAMTDILGTQGPMNQDTVLRETMATFGYARMGPQIRARLTAVLRWALAEGRIQSAGNGLLEPGT